MKDTREMTAERMADVRAVLTSARCSYVGRCNSSRCPVHGVRGAAVADLLAHVDALTARAEAADAEPARAAMYRGAADGFRLRAEAAEAKLAALAEAASWYLSQREAWVASDGRPADGQAETLRAAHDALEDLIRGEP